MCKIKDKILFAALFPALTVPLAASANPVPMPFPSFSFDENFSAGFRNSAIFLAAGMICELFVGYIYCLATKIPKRILLWIALANLISFPVFSALLVPAIDVLGLIGILVLEAIVVVFEAFFIHNFNKFYITINKAFVLSLIMNIISFVIPPTFFLILYETSVLPTQF